MIDYGEEASNQMQMSIPGLTNKGQELMEAARKWVAIHRFDCWSWYKKKAKEEGDRYPVSPKFLHENLKRRFPGLDTKAVRSNDYAAALARIALEEDPSLNINVKRSQMDGFTKARL